MRYLQYIITILLVGGIYAKSFGCMSGANGPRKEISTSTHENITRLNLANNNLLIIKRETFNKYQKLEELSIINSRVCSIVDEAFYDLPQLLKVNMSRNRITNLSSKIFRPDNKLRKFVVSNNLLSNIDHFDIGYFSELTTLDISHNQISHLPLSLLDKVKKDSNFSLITANNPLDCTRGQWRSFLDKNLYLKFCAVNTSELFKDVPRFMARMELPPQASFLTCIFYITGSFWCGIIAGNVCLIRKIVIKSKPVLKKDESTQYDSFSFIHSRDLYRSDQKLHTKNSFKDKAVLSEELKVGYKAIQSVDDVEVSASSQLYI